jgi:hypothetical protein
MNKRVYNNGYIPKIEYWVSVAQEHINNGNLEETKYANQKAEYFMRRHQSVYGNTIAGVDFTETLKLLATL